jgi:hypothetical protein
MVYTEVIRKEVVAVETYFCGTIFWLFPGDLQVKRGYPRCHHLRSYFAPTSSFA